MLIIQMVPYLLNSIPRQEKKMKILKIKELLRFRDNFKSYYDRGVFVIVGAALFTPPP